MANPDQWVVDFAHELWPMAQVGPSEGIEDAALRIAAAIQAAFAEREARLVGALEVLRDLPIVENDNLDTLHLKGTPHTGPVVDYFFKIVRMVKQVADQALKDRTNG